MKKVNVILLLVIISFGISSCDKRPFANVELHGRVMNSATNAPLAADIQLWTGSPPGNKSSTKFGSTSAYSDGTFDIKSKAGWNSDEYYLLFILKTNVNGAGSALTKKYTIPKNHNLNVGDILF
jgi:hypothetical protein